VTEQNGVEEVPETAEGRDSAVSIWLQLDEEQSQRLEERARELRVDPRDLAKAAVNDLLSRPSEDFARAANFVLEKNRELYRRLS
jgi:antitoxin FitA